MTVIYFSQEWKSYISTDNIKCCICELEHLVKFMIINTPNEDISGTICFDCFRKVDYSKFACVPGIFIPKEFLPFDIRRIYTFNYKTRLINTTVFEEDKLPSEITIDKTKYANRSSLKGSSVGVIDQERIERLDQDLSEEELNLILTSKPVVDEAKLEYEAQKKIRDKRKRFYDFYEAHKEKIKQTIKQKRALDNQSKSLNTK